MMKYVAKGEKIGIAQIRLEDASLLAQWWNDGAIMKHVGFIDGLHTSKEEIEKEIRMELEDVNPNREKRRFIVYTLKEEIPIGEVSYQALDLRNKSCTFGIKITELSYQGKGLGKDTLITFITYLFQTFSLHRIELDTLLENVRAQSLYLSVGFKAIGVRRDCWIDPLHNYRSALLMDVINEEWFYLHKGVTQKTQDRANA